jgi:hypothetical protein
VGSHLSASLSPHQARSSEHCLHLACHAPCRVAEPRQRCHARAPVRSARSRRQSEAAACLKPPRSEGVDAAPVRPPCHCLSPRRRTTVSSPRCHSHPLSPTQVAARHAASSPAKVRIAAAPIVADRSPRLTAIPTALAQSCRRLRSVSRAALPRPPPCRPLPHPSLLPAGRRPARSS